MNGVNAVLQSDGNYYWHNYYYGRENLNHINCKQKNIQYNQEEDFVFNKRMKEGKNFIRQLRVYHIIGKAQGHTKHDDYSANEEHAFNRYAGNIFE